jgi:hypothetical protein
MLHRPLRGRFEHCGFSPRIRIAQRICAIQLNETVVSAAAAGQVRPSW